jgi:hypothetical protein
MDGHIHGEDCLGLCILYGAALGMRLVELPEIVWDEFATRFTLDI